MKSKPPRCSFDFRTFWDLKPKSFKIKAASRLQRFRCPKGPCNRHILWGFVSVSMYLRAFCLDEAGPSRALAPVEHSSVRGSLPAGPPSSGLALREECGHRGQFLTAKGPILMVSRSRVGSQNRPIRPHFLPFFTMQHAPWGPPVCFRHAHA